jgi:hypothetical protein
MTKDQKGCWLLYGLLGLAGLLAGRYGSPGAAVGLAITIGAISSSDWAPRLRKALGL